MDVFIHNRTKVRKLGKIKALPNGLLERIPIAAEMLADRSPGCTANRMDAAPRNELVQRAMPALFDTGMQPIKRLLAKTFSFDDFVPMTLQLIQVAKALDPASVDELFQRFGG